MSDEMITIGPFAVLTGLTIHALRHYDEIGLLRPADVDTRTGYRRYRRIRCGKPASVTVFGLATT